ncbi:MAG: hypothetical protein ABID61_05580 [Candidatus Micrarchaeota archaeon]
MAIIKTKIQDTYRFGDKVRPFFRGLIKLKPFAEVAGEGLRRGCLSEKQGRVYQARVDRIKNIPTWSSTSIISRVMVLATIGITLSFTLPSCRPTKEREKLSIKRSDDSPLKHLTSRLLDINHGIKDGSYHVDLDVELINESTNPPPKGLQWMYSVCFDPPGQCIIGGIGEKLDGLAQGRKQQKQIRKVYGYTRLCSDGNDPNTCISIRGSKPKFTITVSNPKNLEDPWYEAEYVLRPAGYYK